MTQQLVAQAPPSADLAEYTTHVHHLLTDPWPLITPDEREQAVRLRWLASIQNDLTAKAYERDINRYMDWCYDSARVDPMAAIRSTIDLYSKYLRGLGLRPATIHRHLSSVSGFYRYARSEGVLPANPVEDVKRAKVPKDSQQIGLDQGELIRFLHEAAWHTSRASGTRDRDRTWALVCLLVYDGLRISEALTAKVGDLSQYDGHHALRVTRKGGAEQDVALNPTTTHALNLYIGDRTKGSIFLTSTGEQWERTSAFRTVKVIARRAGLSAKVGPHSLRHTFVTLSRQFGVSLEDVQDAAGHASADTTRRYDRKRFAMTGHPAYVLGQKLVVNLPPRDESPEGDGRE